MIDHLLLDADETMADLDGIRDQAPDPLIEQIEVFERDVRTLRGLRLRCDETNVADVLPALLLFAGLVETSMGQIRWSRAGEGL